MVGLILRNSSDYGDVNALNNKCASFAVFLTLERDVVARCSKVPMPESEIQVAIFDIAISGVG